MKKLLLIFLTSIAAMFLSFSFVLMDCNPLNWEIGQRLLLLFLSACLAIIIITLNTVNKI